MAYNRKNHLEKVIEVQKLYTELKEQGLFTRKIHRDYIKPRYFISISTLYEYLATPAKRDLKRILEAEKAQTKLFDEE